MINVVWFDVSDRLRKNCTATLNWMLDTYACAHHYGSVPDGIDGAAVVVHGETVQGTARLNTAIAKLKWVVLIYLGDETRIFPLEGVCHSNMRIWCQDPLPGRHEFCDRFILNGWTPDCKYQEAPRDLDWFFAGQVVHERREQVVKALRDLPGGGFIIQTRGYTQGISIQEYWRCLSRAKFVPCPCGFNTPDTARPWESLECGAVPILDARSFPPRTEGIWNMLLPKDHPLPVMYDWTQLGTWIQDHLPMWDEMQIRCHAWWQEYKLDFLTWLQKDIDELS
jgi:hypothetical protein